MTSAHHCNLIFVSSLSYKTLEADVQAHFEKCGELESIELAKNVNGQSKGYCFIYYRKSHDAEYAAKTLDHSILNGNEIHVELNYPRPSRKSEGRRHEEQSRRRDDIKQKEPAKTGQKVEDGKAPSKRESVEGDEQSSEPSSPTREHRAKSDRDYKDGDYSDYDQYHRHHRHHHHHHYTHDPHRRHSRR